MEGGTSEAYDIDVRVSNCPCSASLRLGCLLSIWKTKLSPNDVDADLGLCATFTWKSSGS